MSSRKGYISLVLHAHLPFINHPEYDYFFEENWLFQAISDCYIPLLQKFENLHKEKLKFRITFSLSPTLLSMLENKGLQDRYVRHLNHLIELCEKEVAFNQNPDKQQELAQYYKEHFENCLQYFEKHKRELTKQFVKLHKKGCLELITTVATHALLPLYQSIPESILAQIQIGKDFFIKCTGIQPKGIWLPECGYCEGLEDFIKKAGYEYCFLDTSSIDFASPNIHKNVYRVIQFKNGIKAMARDPDSSHQVWSAESGYPSDSDYREYHKDLTDSSTSTHVLEFTDYYKHHCQSGLKYWAIEEYNNQKSYYDIERATNKAKHHAREFLLDKRNQIRDIHEEGSEFLITAPFDAELFGHWWHEGPIWLEELIRLSNSQGDLELTSASNLSNELTCAVNVQPRGSTWGKNNNFEHWVNPSNDWIYPKLFEALKSFQELLKSLNETDISQITDRALKQAARSILLAQSSDWAFMIRTAHTHEYAFKRFKDSLARYHFLEHSIKSNDISKRKLQALEMMDDIFPEIDYHLLKKCDTE